MSVVVGYRNDHFGEAALEHGVARAVANELPLIVVNVAKDDALDAPGFVRGHELETLRHRVTELVGAKVTILQPVGPDTAAQILRIADETVSRACWSSGCDPVRRSASS